MKMTNDDFIDVLDNHNYGMLNMITYSYDEVLDRITILSPFPSRMIPEKWTELPDGVVFSGILDLDKSHLTSLGEGTICLNSIYIKDTFLSKLPVLNIGCNLMIYDSLNISFGTFIKKYVFGPMDDIHDYDSILINGYMVNGGIIS